jgi:Tol biopolymer transport system component
MPTDRSGLIAFSSGKQGDYDIWMLNLDNDQLVQLTHGQYWNDKPKWSPDAQWIVYVSNVKGTPNIYKVSPDGRQTVPLVEDDRWNDFPAFSPDGSKLGYVSNISGNNDLWIANVDGSNPRQLTSYDGDDTSFAWLPDGQSVLFSSDRDGSSDIWRLDLRSGEKTQLTTDPGMDIYPAVSPCGQYVAFVSNRQFDPDGCDDHWDDRDQDIWLMTITGQHQVRITSNQKSDHCVAWSPDGTCLVYASSSGSTSERLRIADVSGVLDAYASGDSKQIQKAADHARSASLKLDREPLKQEIGGQRHTNIFTSLLPDAVMRHLYSEDYFGTERYPDWIPAGGWQSQSQSSRQTAAR